MNRQERSRITRDRLLELGRLAFGRYGYYGTSIQDIVGEAGVPKGSFYNYFDSKESFGAEVVGAYVQRIFDRLDGLLSEDGESVDKLRGFFAGLLQDQEEHKQGCLVGNLGSELGSGDGTLREALRRGEAGIRLRFSHLIARAQEEGAVRRDVPAEDLAGLLFSAWEGALMRMQVEGSTGPVKKTLRLLLDGYFPR